MICLSYAETHLQQRRAAAQEDVNHRLTEELATTEELLQSTMDAELLVNEEFQVDIP